MNSNLSLEPRDRWLWWTCGTAFLIGMALGWRVIRSESKPLPILASINQFEETGLKLKHPLPRNVSPANPAGSLRFWLYSGRELAGLPLAQVVKPPVFNPGTPWLQAFIDEKLAHSSDNFSLRMQGWIVFSSPLTMVHLRSDNGYRIRFRNALGEVQRFDHWVDEVTDDFAFKVAAEPGRYEIEIDYFNGGGGLFFETWCNPQAELEPAMDPQPAAR
jgi:hypothetical protein